jgi:hypothetical protein
VTASGLGWARAINGHAAALPSNAMHSRRLMGSPQDGTIEHSTVGKVLKNALRGQVLALWWS